MSVRSRCTCNNRPLPSVLPGQEGIITAPDLIAYLKAAPRCQSNYFYLVLSLFFSLSDYRPSFPPLSLSLSLSPSACLPSLSLSPPLPLSLSFSLSLSLSISLSLSRSLPVALPLPLSFPFCLPIAVLQCWVWLLWFQWETMEGVLG